MINQSTRQQNDIKYDVPVVSGRPQAQGDLIILDWPEDVAPNDRRTAIANARPIPKKGHVVLLGDDGHAHLLIGNDKVTWFRYPGQANQTIGVVNVQEGGLAVLGHEEHGDSYIGSGVYVIRRQREMWDGIRLVAD